jgi:HD-GYP domain-containing protein (c-di-GMP phosphodiesterase class II)
VAEDLDAGPRLAELTIALSLATDLGTGQPLEHGLRTCLLSVAAAEALGLDTATRSCVYHVALLRFLGCTSDASEFAALVGDDVLMNGLLAPVFHARRGQLTRFFLRHVGDDLALHHRAVRVARALGDPDGDRRSLTAHCEVATRLAARLGMGATVGDALAHAYERWDGKGYPDGLAGEDVPVAIRIVSVARDVEIWCRQGWDATAQVLTSRRSRAYDPSVVDAFLASGQAWLAGIGDDPCPQVLEAEPGPPLAVDPDRLDAALGAVADFSDLKSPWFLGHSHRVAELAGAAAAAAGLSDDDAATVRRVGLVHDVGQVGVAASVWDRAGPLTAEQWERVRLHPYLSERVLGHCAALSPFAALAGHHHERADASGYHRGLGGDHLGTSARLLAAADAFCAMGEDRPHRPALAPSAAAAALGDEVDAGRLGRAEVDAVLTAAGQHPRPPRVARPAGLTEREVDVLRLIARGQPNKAVAASLGISPKTVGRHVEHIYAKAGVRTRAGATLFALEQSLLEPQPG